LRAPGGPMGNPQIKAPAPASLMPEPKKTETTKETDFKVHLISDNDHTLNAGVNAAVDFEKDNEKSHSFSHDISESHDSNSQEIDVSINSSPIGLTCR